VFDGGLLIARFGVRLVGQISVTSRPTGDRSMAMACFVVASSGNVRLVGIV
jgi:hypothetical protein